MMSIAILILDVNLRYIVHAILHLHWVVARLAQVDLLYSTEWYCGCSLKASWGNRNCGMQHVKQNAKWTEIGEAWRRQCAVASPSHNAATAFPSCSFLNQYKKCSRNAFDVCVVTLQLAPHTAQLPHVKLTHSCCQLKQLSKCKRRTIKACLVLFQHQRILQYITR